MTNMTDRSFFSERLVVEPSGKIIVKCSFGNGYAWDGCTPKWNCLHITWGTPDGKLDYVTEKPMTYYASMFHDALYQCKDKGMCISRKETDVIFRLLMRKNKFMWSTVYYIAVRMFGGFCGSWKWKTSKSGVKISECSWDQGQDN